MTLKLRSGNRIDMDIREFLKLGSARLNADILVDKIEEDTDVFDTVWDIMFEDIYPLSMRAGWAIYLFAQKHPYFLFQNQN